MKLLTKLKLRLEVVLKAVNLDWREVAVELMTDLFEERKRRFAFEQENYDLKQQLAIYKEKEQGEQYV
ncbi:TPA: hypothetical protein VU175_002215 [Streptococcus pneumoniae]|uniref:Uncharacterized protein n=4 Tax=root TaxID=1 RepID=A0A141E013_9CAUD|nr:hypothetical protein [Streptococcus pneumoniae]YP_009324924.1 hypothetical protein BOW99_gp34 [Streptococcus phage phiARI0462]ALA47760.1 hypothetical protein phiARI0455b_36 [Streptococcus phage phiARI0455b]APD23523.1 hypothetical protein IPP46_00015 [Streptococcus phage IPP46]CBW39273.1 Phage protein [Streptococcus phage 2167]ADM92231.1 conserved hypothetical protein [Streptococcus pneumoniae 670-6B]ALA47072.1 hypothetical protein phiARI0462_42 [Streptococcus phage phiARI0462]